MIERNRVNENAAEVKSPHHSVRVLWNGDKMLFAAHDIAAACGIKAPTKWVVRTSATRPDINGESMTYPMMTAKGMRRIKMFFVTAAVAKRILNLLACPDETRRWIIEEVLTCKIDIQEPVEAQPEEETQPETEKGIERPEAGAGQVLCDELGQRIDRILLELLEIKRCVSAGK